MAHKRTKKRTHHRRSPKGLSLEGVKKQAGRVFERTKDKVEDKWDELEEIF